MANQSLNNRCVVCGADLAPPVRRDIPDDSLPGVMLCGIEVSTCPSCGEEEIAIPNIEGLHRELARLLAGKPSRLTGREVRFLRKVMGWSGRSFALLIGVTPETVSRWENDKEPIGPVAERLLRVLVTQKVQPITDYDAFEAWITRLAEQSGAESQPATSVQAHLDATGWHARTTGARP